MSKYVCNECSQPCTLENGITDSKVGSSVLSCPCRMTIVKANFVKVEEPAVQPAKRTYKAGDHVTSEGKEYFLIKYASKFLLIRAEDHEVIHVLHTDYSSIDENCISVMFNEKPWTLIETKELTRTDTEVLYTKIYRIAERHLHADNPNNEATRKITFFPMMKDIENLFSLKEQPTVDEKSVCYYVKDSSLKESVSAELKVGDKVRCRQDFIIKVLGSDVKLSEKEIGTIISNENIYTVEFETDWGTTFSTRIAKGNVVAVTQEDQK